MELNAYRLVFPVLGGKLKPESFEIRAIVGTAFSIGKGYFLTCSHVVDSALGFDSFALGESNISLKAWNAVPVIGYEQHKGIDVAIIHCPMLTDINTRKWVTPGSLPMSLAINATGFPHGLNKPGEGSIQIRSFDGTISSKTNWDSFSENPDIYELSFPAPRGLSGSPLCTKNKVAGVIFGNRNIEMTVFTETETNKEGDHTTVYEKVEAYRAGVAIQSISIFSKKSDILGCGIGNHLEKQGLVEQ